MASSITIPKTMKALVVTSTKEPPIVETVPTPVPTEGSAVVRILAANVIGFMRDIFNGNRGYPFTTPLIPGASAVARVAAVGPDATKVKPGDLVFLDGRVRSRDNPTDIILAGFFQGVTPGSAKLMTDVWRNWSYAEYAKVPLENLTLVDEKRVTGAPSEGGLGYRIEDLGFVSSALVPYGGLRDIELRAGQIIIIAPATGPYGSAAVLVALAMGARVVAMGRNTATREV